MVGLEDGLLLPLPRPVSLKNRSIDIVRALPGDPVIGPMAHDTAKGTVAHLKPPRTSVEEALTRVQPRWVVLPKFEAGSECAVQPMAPGRKTPVVVGANADLYREWMDWLSAHGGR